jgi:tetratricopeptide (TPR) repeat protein
VTRTTTLGVSAGVGALLILAGCASGARQAGLNSRLIRQAARNAPEPPAPYDTGTRADSLETFMGQLREISVRARPVPWHSSGPTIEGFDPALRAALLALDMAPTAETHRRVAEEYARLRVLDAAHKHYRAALTFDPDDGAAYDGLARLWRDAGLPWLGLGEARRAVYYAPRSAEARNTLGTVFQALGHNREARSAYSSALALNPSAAYALNNLGYLALVEGDSPRAIRLFGRALAAQPDMATARHNLALAYASADQMDLARQALIEKGPPAQASYNLGIISLARGEKVEAMNAFERACQIDPAQPQACDRAAALRTTVRVTGGGTP